MKNLQAIFHVPTWSMSIRCSAVGWGIGGAAWSVMGSLLEDRFGWPPTWRRETESTDRPREETDGVRNQRYSNLSS